MQKNMTHTKKIFVFILAVSMLFFCTLSFDELTCGIFSDFSGQFRQLNDSPKTNGMTELKQTRSTRIRDGLASEVRTLAELEKEKLEKNASGRLDSALLYSVSTLLLLLLLLKSACRAFFDEKELQPARYSIISYLHRSDGEKPALSA